MCIYFCENHLKVDYRRTFTLLTFLNGNKIIILKNYASLDLVITLKTIYVIAGKSFHHNFLNKTIFSNKVKGEAKIILTC